MIALVEGLERRTARLVRERSVAHLVRKCLGFIFCDFFSNVGRTGCRRGRTPERPLRQPPQDLAAGPDLFPCRWPLGASEPHVCVGPYSAVPEVIRVTKLSIAKSCAAAKFRSTVDPASFPFCYLTRTGASRQGEELSGIRCVAGIACPLCRASLDGTLPGTSRAKAKVGNQRSLSRQDERVPGLKRSDGARFHTAERRAHDRLNPSAHPQAYVREGSTFW